MGAGVKDVVGFFVGFDFEYLIIFFPVSLDLSITFF